MTKIANKSPSIGFIVPYKLRKKSVQKTYLVMSVLAMGLKNYVKL